MIIKFSFTTLLFLMSNICFSKKKIIGEQDSVNQVVTKYFQAVEAISNCNGINSAAIEADLLELNDRDDPTNYVYNDLFYSDPTKVQEHVALSDYLARLDEDYKYGVKVQYDSIEMLPCTEQNGENRFACVKAYKTLTYNGQTKTCHLLIFVNVDRYKIAQVTTPFLYDCDTAKMHNCKSSVGDYETDSLIKSYEDQGENYYTQNDFLNAKKFYALAAQTGTEQATVSYRLSQCDSLITLKDLLTKANNNFNDSDYRNALDNYNTILSSYDQYSNNSQADTAAIRQKINACVIGISRQRYNHYVKQGDDRLQYADFVLAKQFYDSALMYKPNDPYVLAKLKEVKKEDKKYAKARIREAMAENQSGQISNYDLFVILSQYERSGLLTTENYFFLGTVMYNYHPGEPSTERLGYINEHGRDYYLKIYGDRLPAPQIGGRYFANEQQYFALKNNINNSLTHTRAYGYANRQLQMRAYPQQPGNISRVYPNNNRLNNIQQGGASNTQSRVNPTGSHPNNVLTNPPHQPPMPPKPVKTEGGGLFKKLGNGLGGAIKKLNTVPVKKGTTTVIKKH